jgi:xanthine dehydrogenase YagS FAD-binding subunit
MKAFFYHRPTALDEAIGMLGAAARPLAGGTDLVTLIKAGLAAPEHLVALRRLLPNGIHETPEGVTLGAGTTLSEIESSALLAPRYAALAQAAAVAATPQLRNEATLGGNLLQRPRCWYFRHPDVHCWLKGGAECPARDGENARHALFGGGPCVAVHPSDLAPALAAFDAELRLRGPRRERVSAIEDFFAMPAEDCRTETRLADNELVVSVLLPTHPEETRSIYLKAMDREAFSFALVSVAAVLRLSAKGRIGHARVVLGGVAPIPWRAHAAERVLLSAPMSEPAIEEAAEAALEGTAPLRHNAWKVPLAKALVQRALRALARAQVL